MKALAARPRDAEEIQQLAKVLDVHRADEVLAAVHEVFPDQEPDRGSAPGGSMTIPDLRPAIPRISHELPLSAVYEGIRLQLIASPTGQAQGADLGFVLVAGVGFEPT